MREAWCLWYPAIPPIKQRLMFDDTCLDDSRTLADYGIRQGSLLQLQKMIDIEITIYEPKAVCTQYKGVAGTSNAKTTVFPLKVGCSFGSFVVTDPTAHLTFLNT